MNFSVSLVKISKGYYFPAHFFTGESKLQKILNIFPARVFLSINIQKEQGNLFLNDEEFFVSLKEFLSIRINSVYSYYLINLRQTDESYDNEIFINSKAYINHRHREYIPMYYSVGSYLLVLLFENEKDRDLFLSEWGILRKLEQE